MKAAFDQQRAGFVARRIAELREVSHAHAIFVARVHDHVLRRLQASRQGDVARQDARQQQRRARFVHGMQIQQPIGALDPRPQLGRAPAVAAGGVVQSGGAPDAVHILVHETRSVMARQVEAVECRQVAEGQCQTALPRPQPRRQQILQRPGAAQFVAVHQRRKHQGAARHAGVEMPDTRRVGIALALGGEVGNGKREIHGVACVAGVRDDGKSAAGRGDGRQEAAVATSSPNTRYCA